MKYQTCNSIDNTTHLLDKSSRSPMETEFTPVPNLALTVKSGHTHLFTSLLQAGIQISAMQGVTIGVFLQGLPGFSVDYITEQVQTIFYNGTATDDLNTVMRGHSPVLAISAAMPGLAGAIFRRNSLHAALRTEQKQADESSSQPNLQMTVLLKLFNSIARDRGGELLQRGVIIQSSGILKFLEARPASLKYIEKITLADTPITVNDLHSALSGHAAFRLFLT